MRYELLSCPFCGGHAKIYTSVSDGIPRKSKAFVYCNKCKASGDTYEDTENDGEFIFKAIDAWNRRATR